MKEKKRADGCLWIRTLLVSLNGIAPVYRCNKRLQRHPISIDRRAFWPLRGTTAFLEFAFL